MLKISLHGKTICFVPTAGLTFDQLIDAREIVASKEGVNIYELNLSRCALNGTGRAA